MCQKVLLIRKRQLSLWYHSRKEKTMKGTQFNFVAGNNAKFEVYNETEGTLHCVLINKKGEKCSPNAKTLKQFSNNDFSLGLQTGGIVLL